MVKRNDKTNTGEGGKDKRGRTVSDDVCGKYLSDMSTSVDVKSTVIHTSVNTFETSNVVFLTPNTTRGSLLVICQVENT